MERYYTPEQIADLLTVQKQTVYAWLRSGKLSGVKLGKIWRVSERRLQEYLGEKPQTPPSPQLMQSEVEHRLDAVRERFSKSAKPERLELLDSLPYDG